MQIAAGGRTRFGKVIDVGSHLHGIPIRVRVAGLLEAETAGSIALLLADTLPNSVAPSVSNTWPTTRRWCSTRPACDTSAWAGKASDAGAEDRRAPVGVVLDHQLARAGRGHQRKGAAGAAAETKIGLHVRRAHELNPYRERVALLHWAAASLR